MTQKPRLGRGLDALIAGPAESPTGPTAVVAINRIQINPFQPRKAFDDDELAKLTDSVREHGVLQPVVVRPAGEGFQLIAGERRLRAAQNAGLGEIPIRIVDFNDQQVLEAALVENIQRSDLNAIEKAQGFKDYLDRFDMKQEQIGRAPRHRPHDDQQLARPAELAARSAGLGARRTVDARPCEGAQRAARRHAGGSVGQGNDCEESVRPRPGATGEANENRGGRGRGARPGESSGGEDGPRAGD